MRAELKRWRRSGKLRMVPLVVVLATSVTTLSLHDLDIYRILYHGLAITIIRRYLQRIILTDLISTLP